MAGKRILVINLGSTSTKIGIYIDSKMEMLESIRHPADELAKFDTIWDQHKYRQDSILKQLEKWNVSLNDIDIISCRGGCVKPIQSGIYIINQAMLDDIRTGEYGVHPTGLGNIIAFDLGKQYNIPAVTLDTPATDEFCEEARFTGIPEIKRISSFHALNQKATAKKVAAEIGKKYEDLNMIVAHIGGGITVGAHLKGKVVDVNNGLDGTGPYSPERAGTVPSGELIKMCFSGKYTEAEMKKLVQGRGGLMGHLGTTDAQEVEKRIASGDKFAEQVYNAMIYQIAREIGSCAPILDGKVDAIALTGSLVYSEYLVSRLEKKISFIAKVYKNPGENEVQALAEGAVRFYTGEEGLQEYK